MVCNTLEFTVINETPQQDVSSIIELLRRRGAFFSHIYSIWRPQRAVQGWRMSVPVELPWEPFHLTLKESGIVYWMDMDVEKKDIIPIHDGD
jgi:hypothetical protein